MFSLFSLRKGVNNLAEYKLNSNVAKESNLTAQRKRDKVVSEKTTTRKKTEVEKIATDISSVKSTVISDIVIPTVKQLISEMIKTSVDMLLFHEVRRDDRRPTASKISYNSYYDDRSRYTTPNATRNAYDYDDVVFQTRGDAESVLGAMEEIVDQFDIVSIADFYELSDIPNPNFTTTKYGWTNLRTAEVIRLRGGGYAIKFPRASRID